MYDHFFIFSLQWFSTFGRTKHYQPQAVFPVEIDEAHAKNPNGHKYEIKSNQGKTYHKNNPKPTFHQISGGFAGFVADTPGLVKSYYLHNHQSVLFSMDKLNRKSRAPWHMGGGKAPANPYANANVSQNSAENDPYGTSLQVPKTAASNRRHNRRMSIQASAAVPFDPSMMPPVPGAAMYRTGTNNSDVGLVRSFAAPRRSSNEDDIVQIIKTELHDKDVTVIDDFYKSLLAQNNSLDADIKSRINTNQKNILQLTDDLRVTQEELVTLRVSTKELYQILAEFAEAAERRLAIEQEAPKNQGYNGGSLDVPNKKKDRSSVLVLQKMWATELQSLFKHVDGAQKYIQAIPGRHVLAESGRWHEINIGTWKPSRPIHLFLLNDLVMVATRKLPQEGSSKRLQAIYCWPLQLVDISEIQAPSQVSSKGEKIHVINLRAPSFSYVYQTDRYDHFTRVMNAYHKGKAELAQRNKMIEDEEPKNVRASGEFGYGLNSSSASLHDDKLELRNLRESLRSSGLQGHSRSGSTEEVGFNRRTSGQRHSNDVILQDISARVHSRNRSHDYNKEAGIKRPGSDKLPQRLFLELKNAEDKLDEVDVDLAHNNYSQATQLMTIIDQKVASIVMRVAGFKSKEDDGALEELRILVDVVKLKLGNRRFKIQQNLQFDLQHNILTYTNETISELLSYYSQFDMQSEGISAILEALSAHLSKTVGKLISNAHGSTKVDIINYLANLTIIYVLIIRRALQIYGECIEGLLHDSRHGNLDSSGFITWCISEMSRLVDIIKKHAEETLLFKEGKIWYVKDDQHYKELLAIILPQLSFLKDEGLNVDYLFEDILHCQPKAQ